jgi:hypothetical protein
MRKGRKDSINNNIAIEEVCKQQQQQQQLLPSINITISIIGLAYGLSHPKITEQLD